VVILAVVLALEAETTMSLCLPTNSIPRQWLQQRLTLLRTMAQRCLMNGREGRYLNININFNFKD
jgi:hypothetical protein